MSRERHRSAAVQHHRERDVREVQLTGQAVRAIVDRLARDFGAEFRAG